MASPLPSHLLPWSMFGTQCFPSLSRAHGGAANPTLTSSPAGPSRCFPFWQELLACYVVNSDSEDNSGAKKCVPALDDYMECLHHTKEVVLAAPLIPLPVARQSSDGWDRERTTCY